MADNCVTYENNKREREVRAEPSVCGATQEEREEDIRCDSTDKRKKQADP